MHKPLDNPPIFNKYITCRFCRIVNGIATAYGVRNNSFWKYFSLYAKMLG
jgi:hypothetical protein